MSVEFEEQQISVPIAEKRKSFADFLMKTGIAKTQNQANVTLLIVATLLIGVAAFIFVTAITPQQDQSIYQPDPDSL